MKKNVWNKKTISLVRLHSFLHFLKLHESDNVLGVQYKVLFLIPIIYSIFMIIFAGGIATSRRTYADFY